MKRFDVALRPRSDSSDFDREEACLALRWFDEQCVARLRSGSLDTGAAHATCCAVGEATRGHNAVTALVHAAAQSCDCTAVRIAVFSSAIVIDVIVHCHTAGALLSQTAENNCPYHRVVGF